MAGFKLFIYLFISNGICFNISWKFKIIFIFVDLYIENINKIKKCNSLVNLKEK